MKLLLISGLLFFFGSIVLILRNYEKFNIERNGQVVKMRIENLPKSCVGAKVQYFIKFSYNGEMYDKQTRGDFCERHYIGELIDMKMIENSGYILFPHESALFDLISFAALGLFGLIISITQWKKINNEK